MEAGRAKWSDIKQYFLESRDWHARAGEKHSWSKRKKGVRATGTDYLAELEM